MDTQLHAFFREAQNVSLNSSDKASVRDVIASLIQSVMPQQAPELVPVPVRASCAR